jgi:hypothetical protein
MLFRKKQLTVAFESSIQAEYEDGFILDEAEHMDVSPYDKKKVKTDNIMRAILNKDPEAEHGKMVRFSVFYMDKWHHIDWTKLPDNARPIRFRNMSADFGEDGKMENLRLNWVQFGYQFNDKNGKNQQKLLGA